MQVVLVRKLLFAALAVCSVAPLVRAQDAEPVPMSAAQSSATGVGPYYAHLLQGGAVLDKPLPPTFSAAGWTEWAWVEVPSTAATGEKLIAGVGNRAKTCSRMLALQVGRPEIRLGSGDKLSGTKPLDAGWHLIAASGEGEHARLFVDGVLATSGQIANPPCSEAIELAPNPSDADAWTRFGGRIAFSAAAQQLSSAEISDLMNSRSALDAAMYEENAKPWPLQKKQQAGYTAPQAPETMPHGAPATKGIAKELPAPGPTLVQSSAASWELARNWRLYSNDITGEVLAPTAGGHISSAGFEDKDWMAATVPGTVLTTMIDRGIYPDPYLGLNNLDIPESLNKHDYWYRVSFPTPASAAGERFFLQFAGINYTADVWLNGTLVGSMRGAFRRGDFDVTRLLHHGSSNSLAVRIAPPPHPGIPHEQSIADGPGANGGALLIDGPTFVASEGWDWLPAIRDRETGIWQGVSLRRLGAVQVGDVQVITHLPLPDRTSADVELHVPVHNASAVRQMVRLQAEFEGVKLSLGTTVAPGDSVAHLLPAQFPQMHLTNPRLWWPNGYGSPELYHLTMRLLGAASAVSDERKITFGVREISYELSLFDHTGNLRRVEVMPTVAHGQGFTPVDVRHEGMRQTANGWASSLTPQAEGSSAVRTVTNEPGMTDLVIKVNGVRIAVRGGNWGMDDALKRVEKSRLEPYFRLHQEANLNIVRNWVGQDTEESFFELADEYGMMVWNDFWASTQDYNAEPGDSGLFLDNVRDTVRHFRNHPSIVIWCGRNEGVPPPVLNEGIIRILAAEDETRFYSPGSNKVNLRGSGPYKWHPPADYFTSLDQGFAVELGIPSFPTREAFAHTVAPADEWPLNDDWAYHDWHQGGGGDTHEQMRHVDLQLGPSQSLHEFEKRQQMFSYVDHQAIFEGMYQHLWAPNSGRMIWMTHPAWPSTMWQMYSSDYDTQASFYAIRKANAPMHVQMDPSEGEVMAVNTTLVAQPGIAVMARAFSPQGKLLLESRETVDVPMNGTVRVASLPLDDLYAKSPMLLIQLTMAAQNGLEIANNLYWICKDEAACRAVGDLPTTPLSLSAAEVTPVRSGERTIQAHVRNASSVPTLEVKVTLLKQDGTRVLPAYYDDNYFSLMPGEERTVSIQIPAQADAGTKLSLGLRGWNAAEATVEVAAKPN